MKKVFSKEKLFVTLIQDWLKKCPWIIELDKEEFDDDMKEFVDPTWCIDYPLIVDALGPDATFSKEKYIVQRLHDFINLFEDDCWINKIDGKTKAEIKKMGYSVPKRGFVGLILPQIQEVKENGN